MPSYLPALQTRVPDVSSLTNVLGQLPQQMQDVRRRNLLQEAGGIAAGGDLTGAANALLRGGELQSGLSVMGAARDIRQADRETQMKAMDWIGRAAIAAGNDPAKIQRLKEVGQQAFGVEIDDDDIQAAITMAQPAAEEASLKRRKLKAEIAKTEMEAGIGQGDGTSSVALENKFGKPPAGYRWLPSGDLQAIEGGPATKIPAEAAGRLALMATAKGQFKSAKKALLEPWGISGTIQANIGAGDVGRAQRVVRVAVEAALRAATGAAAPEEEVERYTDMFTPASTDTKKTATQKLKLLEGFMDNAESIIKQGRVAESGKDALPDEAKTTAPPDAAIRFLKTYKDDPNVRRMFEEKYGTSADEYLR